MMKNTVSKPTGSIAEVFEVPVGKKEVQIIPQKTIFSKTTFIKVIENDCLIFRLKIIS